MGAIDDILGNSGGSGYSGMRRLLRTGPVAIDSSLRGGPGSVGSRPSAVGSGAQPKAVTQGQGGAVAQGQSGASGDSGASGGRLYPGGGKASTYVEMYEMMNPEKPESAEERAKREKRERGEAALAAVGGGISALANLFFTSQYAPNAYDPSKGLSAGTRARWDRLKAEREAIRDRYNTGLLNAMMRDKEQAWRQQQWDYQKERDERAEARADAREQRAAAQAERQAALDDAKLALTYGKLTHQGYMNYIAEVKAGKAEELTEAQISRLNRMGTGGGKSGGSGKPGEYPWYDADGEKHFAHSYEAARQNAIDAGTWNETTQSSTSTRTSKAGRRQTMSTTTTEKPGKGYSSKPEKGKETRKVAEALGL